MICFNGLAVVGGWRRAIGHRRCRLGVSKHPFRRARRSRREGKGPFKRLLAGGRHKRQRSRNWRGDLRLRSRRRRKSDNGRLGRRGLSRSGDLLRRLGRGGGRSARAGKGRQWRGRHHGLGLQRLDRGKSGDATDQNDRDADHGGHRLRHAAFRLEVQALCRAIASPRACHSQHPYPIASCAPWRRHNRAAHCLQHHGDSEAKSPEST